MPPACCRVSMSATWQVVALGILDLTHVAHQGQARTGGLLSKEHRTKTQTEEKRENLSKVRILPSGHISVEYEPAYRNWQFWNRFRGPDRSPHCVEYQSSGSL
ncbi:hypothetical protein B0T26DRAFT_218206 [Lasiosphaeria miniovina]|uniref:Secreted protein n=1 Tax=Lasiosphaeria miniovina TaxID=1954250 RepID=A0AA40AUX4_9PEZI|nr:uncharacterized protein B0T26DRAFT_218206 [Lasiosphaeria miniovina]KAK0722409.1 hypothetical protein B0T26DRAFT_218206 [Lasiosphaeria miniovina]